MKVSRHLKCLLRPQSHQKTTVKHRRSIRPFRKVWASLRFRFDAKDDVVTSDLKSNAPESVSGDISPVPVWKIGDFHPSPAALSPAMPRGGDLAAKLVVGLAAAPIQVPLRFADDFMCDRDSFFSPPTRRVSFFEDVSVFSIPSHRSLAEDEKRFLYGPKSTNKNKNLKEREYENSKHCIENAIEEEMFFPNHEGKLVHPAHFRSFVRKILPDLPRDMDVPGYLSFDEYYGVLESFAHNYGTSMSDLIIQSERVEI
ncbi:hypothetical protein FisN_3Lh486 [Fistulifera solaris]|uniref:Uncharacterized protein n=1 Tax=Fistulifera solaris TaxID=1519565 RepID=A0A1Z5J8H4_FISSO|nr:hypothetical protein FisN_3Lh486 [Fistulifera solaris]|eukprot:GAX10287.1 hypothetical protein FisN_3Lh486 [Fistulifera solaris]